MARNAVKKVEEKQVEKPVEKPVEPRKDGDVLHLLTKEQKVALEKELIACEKAIQLAGTTLAQSAWLVGQNLKEIDNNGLYRSRGFKDFNEYLGSKVEWKMSRQTAYNYIRLTNMTQKDVATIGISLAYKVAGMPDPKAGVQIAKEAIAEKKPLSETMKMVVDAAQKQREEKGIVRSPGAPKKEPEVQGGDKEVTTVTGKTGMVPKRDVTAKLEKIADENLNKAGYTHKAVVLIAGIKMEVRINMKHEVVRIFKLI